MAKKPITDGQQSFTDKPEPPANVRVLEGSTREVPVQPPLSIPVTELNAQNNAFLAMAMREVRSKLEEGQKRRGDGRVIIEFHLAGGTLNGKASVTSHWNISLGR